MRLFPRDRDDVPTEDEISEFLAFAGGDDRAHPYDPFPAQARPQPTWRCGPHIGHAAELGYRDEQDDQ